MSKRKKATSSHVSSASKRQRADDDDDDEEYHPNDDWDAISDDNEHKEEETEPEAAAQKGVTFSIVDGVINVDVPVCTGEVNCSVLHSIVFPTLPDKLVSKYKGYKQGFVQPGVLAILLHCDRDLERFSDHMSSALKASTHDRTYAATCNRRHFNVIKERLNYATRADKDKDKDKDKEKKRTKAQVWVETLEQCKKAITAAPSELVEAFEEELHRPPPSTSSSADVQQLRADLNKVVADWREQLDGVVREQQEREEKREKDQAKRDKTMRDEVGKQIAQGFKAVEKEILNGVERMLASHQSTSQHSRSELATEVEVKQVGVGRRRRGQKMEQKSTPKDSTTVNDNADDDQEEAGRREDDQQSAKEENGEGEEEEEEDEDDGEEEERGSNTSLVDDDETLAKKSEERKADQTKELKAEDQAKEEDEDEDEAK